MPPKPKPLVKNFVKKHVNYYESSRNDPPKSKIGKLSSKYLYPQKPVTSNNDINSLYQKVKTHFRRISSSSTDYGNSQTCLGCNYLLKLAPNKKRAHIKGSSYDSIIRKLINKLHKKNEKGLYYINVTEFHKAYMNEHIKKLDYHGTISKFPAIIPLCKPCHNELNYLNKKNPTTISIKWIKGLLNMHNFNNNYRTELLSQIKKAKVVGDIKDIVFRKSIRNYYKVFNYTPIVNSNNIHEFMNINFKNNVKNNINYMNIN